MLTLRAGRQPQRRSGTAGRPARRASENATKVPLSKKCKLDIKRKHLRAAIPGCLAVNSFPVNLQLQIDGEKLPDLYKCTIKKHVNNKTSCVSYRLQGTGIYNHLRGLYMRGFSCGEEPGVVVLVASREAAPDLSYSGQSDGEDGDYTGDARVSVKADTDSEAEKRQRRQQRQQRSRRQQRKRRREDSDTSDIEEEEQFQAAAVKEEAADVSLPGPSGNHASYPQNGQEAVLAVHQYQYPPHTHPHSHQSRHQRLRSHPVQAFDPSPGGHCGIMDPHAVVHVLPGPGEAAAALLCHGHTHEDAVQTLDVVGVDDELVAAVTEAERRAASQAGPPGPSSSLDPFDQLTLGVGLGMGLPGVGTLGDSGGSLLNGGTAGHGCLEGTGLLGQDAGVCSTVPTGTLHDSVGIVCGGELEGDGSGPHNASATQLGSNFHAQRDPLLDLPISLSPFSPRLLQELTGRPHLPRVGGHHPPSQANWGSMAPLDFDTSFNGWPRQHLNWPDSLSLGLL